MTKSQKLFKFFGLGVEKENFKKLNFLKLFFLKSCYGTLILKFLVFHNIELNVLTIYVSSMVLRGLKGYLKKKNCQNFSELKSHKITHKYQK